MRYEIHIKGVISSSLSSCCYNYTMIYFKFTQRFICCTRTNQFRILSDSLQLVFFDFELLALKICSFEHLVVKKTS